MKHLDTSYLVDLLREQRCGRVGAATRLLERLSGEEMEMSACVLCELRAGAELADDPGREHENVDALERSLNVAPLDASVALHYGRILARLQQDGELIPVMDLQIAATSLAAGAELVTRNRKHFERVPGLKLLTY